jgi:hypothetical protein
MGTVNARATWQAELKRRGLENVKLKPPKGIPQDILKDWIAAEERRAATEPLWALLWASVAGVACVAGVIYSLVK